jgi:hypothetical protein
VFAALGYVQTSGYDYRIEPLGPEHKTIDNRAFKQRLVKGKGNCVMTKSVPASDVRCGHDTFSTLRGPPNSTLW